VEGEISFKSRSIFQMLTVFGEEESVSVSQLSFRTGLSRSAIDKGMRILFDRGLVWGGKRAFGRSRPIGLTERGVRAARLARASSSCCRTPSFRAPH